MSSVALVGTDASTPDRRPPCCLIQCETRLSLWGSSSVVGRQWKDNALFLMQIAFLSELEEIGSSSHCYAQPTLPAPKGIKLLLQLLESPSRIKTDEIF